MTPAEGDSATPDDPTRDTAGDPASDDPLLPAFERVCDRLAGFDPALDVSHVDGFLTAVATAVRPIPMAEWLEALCGDTFDRVFADPEDAAQAQAALQAWASRIRGELDPERLMDDPDRVHIAPLLDDWTDEDRARLLDEGVPAEEVASLHPGAAWRGGFFTALEAFATDWPELEPTPQDEEAQAYGDLIETIGWLAADLADPEFLRFAARQWKGDPPTRDELITEVCFAIQDLRLYGIEHAPRHAPRRVEPVPGRNDPCPCGSGRKYKKCHGA